MDWSAGSGPEFSKHRRVLNLAASHLDCADFRRIRINGLIDEFAFPTGPVDPQVYDRFPGEEPVCRHRFPLAPAMGTGAADEAADATRTTLMPLSDGIFHGSFDDRECCAKRSQWPPKWNFMRKSQN